MLGAVEPLIVASARKHGIADDDILHAIDHSLAVEDLAEDPDRWLVLGPDRAANCSRSSCSSHVRVTS